MKAQRFQVTLGEKIVNELDQMSEEMGVPRASLMALLISDGIQSRKYARACLDSLPDAVKGALSNPDVIRELEKNPVRPLPPV